MRSHVRSAERPGTRDFACSRTPRNPGKFVATGDEESKLQSPDESAGCSREAVSGGKLSCLASQGGRCGWYVMSFLSLNATAVFATLEMLTAQWDSGAREPSLRKSSLRIEELPKITMNGFHPFNASPSPNNSQPISSGPSVLNPFANGVQRKSSAETTGTPTQSRTDSLQPIGLPTSPSSTAALSPTSAASENSPATWSSAIGHATTSGKSGRVIERLMSENDKLKRDLNAQVTRCQDLEKSLQTYKPQIEALRQENDNLSHARGVDSSLISRRDRKIEELKSELSEERSRRERAESSARRREKEKDEMEEGARREAQRMGEETRHATLHAEILETSHRQLNAEYKARAERWRKDLEGISEQREQDRQRMARLDVVAEQMRTEIERSRKINGELVEAWERLREENGARLQGMADETEAENERVRQLSGEMDRVVDQMRWVMGVKKNVMGVNEAQ